MAVVPMQKIGIVGYSEDWQLILSALQMEGAVHIEPINPPQQEIAELEDRLRRIDNAVNFIIEISEHKAKKTTLSPHQVHGILENIDLDTILDKTENLRKNRENLSSTISHSQSRIHTLTPWVNWIYPLELIKDTQFIKIKAGLIPIAKSPIFEEHVKDEELFHLRVIRRSHDGLNIIVYYHKSVSQHIEQILANNEFILWDPKKYIDSPSKEIRKLNAEIERAKRELANIKTEVSKFTPKIVPLWAAGDQLEQTIEQHKALSTASSTASTFTMQGWVPMKNSEKLKRKIEAAFDTVELISIPVLPEDEPPVALKNPFFIESFEVITDLYGRPGKGMVDPTPFIAPFFAIFFALCLTDAGYGLILTLIASVGLYKFRQPGTQKFLRLILYMGLMTILAGIISGSYFGIALPEASEATGLAAIALKLKLFDPLKDIMTFFAISLAFGSIQISIGFLLTMYVHLREDKKLLKKIHDVWVNIAWMATTIGIGLFLMNFVIPEKLPTFGEIGTNMLLVGAIGIVTGHGILGPLAGFSIGQSMGSALAFDGLYGIIGVFSDILSYVRITALGLSTSIVAGVITEMTIKMNGFLLIIGIFILIAGHVFYAVFSSLGSFVHPARLQFVEFFSKFYESEGKFFEPFRRKYKRLNVL